MPSQGFSSDLDWYLASNGGLKPRLQQQQLRKRTENERFFKQAMVKVEKISHLEEQTLSLEKQLETK